MQREKLALSNEVMKVELPPSTISKADVSSVSPSPERNVNSTFFDSFDKIKFLSFD